MRIRRKLDFVVTALELAIFGIRLVDAVKEGLKLREEKLRKRA